MNKKLLKFAVFLLIIIISSLEKTNQIYFVLDPYEIRCMSKMIMANSTFSGSYYATGEYEQMNLATIKNSNNEIIWRDEHHNSASFNLLVEKEGIHTLCIQCLSDKQLNISFDFHDEKKKKEPLSVRKNL